MSAIFVPYDVNVGASAAVLGLLGVLFVELITFWKIVDRAYLELFKLSGFVLFLFFLGTLPYVDNWAHLGEWTRSGSPHLCHFIVWADPLSLFLPPHFFALAF